MSRLSVQQNHFVRYTILVGKSFFYRVVLQKSFDWVHLFKQLSNDWLGIVFLIYHNDCGLRKLQKLYGEDDEALGQWLNIQIQKD